MKAAQAHVEAGYRWVVDIDLEKFFDRVNHDLLMARLARKLRDKTLLRLIRRYLEAGMMNEGMVEPRTEGIPQGGPLSPLLSNILLDDLDKELEKRGHRGRNLKRFIQEDLNPVLRGWATYYRLSGVKVIFEELDAWVRRKLRCSQWRQWKRGRTRIEELCKLGVDQERARAGAFNGRGPWWNAGASHMNAALPTKWFRQRQLVFMLEVIQRDQKQASP